MYCGRCGTEVKEGTKFCPHCGNRLSEETGGGSAAGAETRYAGSGYAAGAGSGRMSGRDNRSTGPGPAPEPDDKEKIPGRGSAIASLVLGIISVALWVFAAAFVVTIFVSVILGIIGLILASNAKKQGYIGGIRTAGFVLSLIGVIGGAVLFMGCVACAGCIGAIGSSSIHF